MAFSKTQNFVLARGINAISRNSLSKKNGRGKMIKKGGEKKVTAVKRPSAKKWYPADYIPKPVPSAKTKRNSVKTAKLRKSITPGTVLILLSGRFRGKRVVFLNQMASGLLLVTGKKLHLIFSPGDGIPMMQIRQLRDNLPPLPRMLLPRCAILAPIFLYRAWLVKYEKCGCEFVCDIEGGLRMRRDKFLSKTHQIMRPEECCLLLIRGRYSRR